MNTAADKIVVIRCGTCTYRLAYPTFFLETGKPVLRKLFKMLRRHEWQNPETIEFLEREFHNLPGTVAARGQARIDKLAARLRESEADYERDFLDPDPATFPKGLTKDQIKSEKAARKEWNAPRLRRVKDAKANLDSAKNDVKRSIERAKQICDLFLTEKRNT